MDTIRPITSNLFRVVSPRPNAFRALSVDREGAGLAVTGGVICSCRFSERTPGAIDIVGHRCVTFRSQHCLYTEKALEMVFVHMCMVCVIGRVFHALLMSYLYSRIAGPGLGRNAGVVTW